MKNLHGINTVRPKTLSRAVKSWQTAPILLIGENEVFSDLELLLEDNWKDFRYAPTPQAGISLWNARRSDVVICGITDRSQVSESLNVLEVQTKNAMMRILLLAGNPCEEAERRMLSRRCAALGLTLVECSKDAHIAKTELSEFLTSVLERGFSKKSNSAQTLMAAFEGYKMGLDPAAREEVMEKQQFAAKASRWFLSQFILDPLAAQAADVLALTSNLWIHTKKEELSSELIGNASSDLLRIVTRSCPNFVELCHSAIKIAAFDPALLDNSLAETIISQDISSIQLKRQLLSRVGSLVEFLGQNTKENLHQLKGAS